MSYWENRAEQRIEAAQEIANSFIPRIARRYVNTCRAINADIDKILKRFMWRFDLTEDEARELLNEKISIEEIELLKRLLNSTAEKHADIEKKLNARAYAYRMSRLEALKADIRLNLEKLAQKSEIDIKDCLQRVTEEADKSVIKDLNDLGNFSLNPGNFFEDIAKQKWYGRNYSQRVWRNTARLEKRLNDTLITGILRGDSVKRLSMDLMDSMKVGIYEAKRLVRTETTYYTNQATLKRYEKVGIKKYRYLAALDARTSEICRDLNGQEFNIEDARVGENYPPMHPHCRSTTVAVIDNVWGKEDNKIRPMANSLRKSPYHILNEQEIELLKDNIRSIEADFDVFRFNRGKQTGFSEKNNIIYICGDVLPDINGMSARDRMSSRAVIAHEYYGHYKNNKPWYLEGDWRDEFRASYRAAIDTPNLSKEERKDLMVDAYDRAKEAGIKFKYSKKARKIIYGY